MDPELAELIRASVRDTGAWSYTYDLAQGQKSAGTIIQMRHNPADGFYEANDSEIREASKRAKQI